MAMPRPVTFKLNPITIDFNTLVQKPSQPTTDTTAYDYYLTASMASLGDNMNRYFKYRYRYVTSYDETEKPLYSDVIELDDTVFYNANTNQHSILNDWFSTSNITLNSNLAPQPPADFENLKGYVEQDDNFMNIIPLNPVTLEQRDVYSGYVGLGFAASAIYGSCLLADSFDESTINNFCNKQNGFGGVVGQCLVDSFYNNNNGNGSIHPNNSTIQVTDVANSFYGFYINSGIVPEEMKITDTFDNLPYSFKPNTVTAENFNSTRPELYDLSNVTFTFPITLTGAVSYPSGPSQTADLQYLTWSNSQQWAQIVQEIYNKQVDNTRLHIGTGPTDPTRYTIRLLFQLTP